MNGAKHPHSWGYAGVHPGEYVLVPDDRTMNRLVFAATHGFDTTDIHLDETSDPDRLARIRGFVEEHDLRITVHPQIDFFAGREAEVRAEINQFVALLRRRTTELPIALVAFCVGPYHRYMDTPSLAFQMDRLATTLPALADACGELGVSLGIENHADYWTSDLAELCERVPGLGIFLDTGNCCVVGERPVEACRLAIPYVVGTHFKDHKVWPKLRDGLAFMVTGAALGDGHVGLREIYADLVDRHPDPESIVMEVELIPDREIGAEASLERTKRFITELCGREFGEPREIRF